MEKFLIILGVILILSFLVIIHELGHYLAARKNGIKVDEFGIGFPPNIFKWKKGDTTWSINAIPFGGFVRLHGEDSAKKGIFKDKKSFASKTPWQKVQVITAGVVMNFLVFWILMSISMMIGIDPLITNSNQFQAAFKDGTYKSEPFVLIKSVEEGSQAEQDGIGAKDTLLAVDGDEVNLAANKLDMLMSGAIEEPVDLSFSRSDSVEYLVRVEPEVFNSDYGINFYPVTSLPSAKVTNVPENSALSDNLEIGDIVTEINDVPVFDFESLITSVYDNADEGETKFEYIRDGEKFEFTMPIEDRQVISGFPLNSIAEEAGMQVGDKILRIEDREVRFGDNVPEIVSSLGSGPLVYIVERDGEELRFNVKPDENGLIGVILAPELNLSDYVFDFQPEYVLSSVVDVKQIKEPWYRAPFTALDQGVVIAGATAKAFLGTLGDVATKLEVSEEVGGPVQVAKLGAHFVSVGGVDLLNFIALISLSLAVINILPIPALDGGRLLFIIIEAFRGKPLNPRAEAIIHYVGFWLLILFILVVTFYDIIRI